MRLDVNRQKVFENISGHWLFKVYKKQLCIYETKGEETRQDDKRQ